MSDMQARILATLQTIEEEEQVRILYACESGSRAWGFASQDSDYDVRFIYIRPRDVYLRLNPPRDVIERPIVNDLDINGWDIFKALRLLRKSNPPLLEWLFSPIIYSETSTYIEVLRTMVRTNYSATAIFYHYSRMAYVNYHQYLEQKSAVIVKKYLYVLRPLIALLYVEEHGQLPPTNFMETMAQVNLSAEVREGVQNLVKIKQAGNELGMGAPEPVLNAFIEELLGKWTRENFDEQAGQEAFQHLDSILLALFKEQNATA